MKISSIIRAASSATGMSESEITSRCRLINEYVFVRTAISIVAQKSGHSLLQIGRALRRDHSTIRSSVISHAATPRVVELVAAIEDLLERYPNPDDMPVRHRIVVPFPPGVGTLVLRGVPIVRLRKLYPEWRVGQ